MSDLNSNSSKAKQQKAEKRAALLKVLITGLIGSTVTVLYWVFHEKIGFKFPKLESEYARLAYAAKFLVLSSLPMFVSMFDVIRGRVTNPDARNPLSGNEHFVQKANRILQNTLEQTILHVLNVVAFAALVSSDYVFMIPYVVFLFTIGRIIYWIGYSMDPKHRGPGFILTFLPTIVLFVFNLVKIIGIF